jgi:GNAT superfamily N-acetyltransferase
MTMRFSTAAAQDAEALVALRIAAMRESLQAVGRFDPQRARDRFLSTFNPAVTWWIACKETRAGFVVVRREGDHLLLDHLYLHPDFQRQGIGSAVLAEVFARADSEDLPVRVGALVGSEANRFYRRQGFIETGRDEFDVRYERPVGGPIEAAAPPV